MKAKLYLTVCTTALLIASGQANADCPNGHVPANTGINVVSVTGGIGAFSIGGAVQQDTFDSGPKTDANCYTAGSLSIGGAPAVTAGAVVDDQGNDDPTDDVSHYLPPVTAVLGQNSTALGNGASVGRVENYTTAGADGVLGDDPETVADESADDVQQTRIVPVNNGTALGAGASVEHNNSTAIGAGAKSTTNHQVTLGTKDETIRAQGVTSQKSKDRQQGPVEVVTSDSGGRLATDGGQIFSTLGTHNDQIQHLYGLHNQQQQTLNAHTALLSEHTAKLEDHSKGLAIAMAMPDAWLSDKKRFGLFGAVGGYDGETAIGFAAIGRIDETFTLNAKVGTDTDFDNFGWQVGVGAQW
jgi:hypothetical protein